MPNPFFYGPCIQDERYFVGRRAELRQIFSAFETAYTGQVQPVSIVGPRRIGKSSLLIHVTQVYRQHLKNPAAYRFVYVDLDDPHCHTQAGLLGYILDALRCSGPAASSVLTLAAFADCLEQFNRQNACCTIICLDEFEHLARRRAEFPDEFFVGLRSLAQKACLSLLTASRIPLQELFPPGWQSSPFFNIFTLVELKNLTEAEADALVDRGRACDRPFSGDDCAELRKLAGENPYALQVAGSLLYEAKAQPPVDWARLRRDFHAQVNYALGHQPFEKKLAAWLAKAGRWLLHSPQHLGRAVLDLLKYDKAAESTAWIVGSVLIVVAILVLVRAVDPALLIDLFKRAWKFLNPAK
jgi:hypothetical protein